MSKTMTAVAALALYDARNPVSFSDMSEAAEAMAEVLRAQLAKKPAAAAAKAPENVLNAQNLAAALKRVSATIPSRCTIPGLGRVWLSVDNGVMTLFGCDTDMESSASLIGADAFNGLNVAVNAKDLLNALRGAKGGVTFEGGEETSPRVSSNQGGKIVSEPAAHNELRVMADGATAALPAYDPKDMATLNRTDWSGSFDMPVADLVEALRFVEAGISTEETRYYLNGVYLHTYMHAGEPQLRFVTTDGHRLFMRAMPVPEGCEMSGFILPRAAVSALLATLPKTGDVVVTYGDNQMSFETDRGVLRATLIDGAYPDYMRVIPRLGADLEATTIMFDDAKAAIAIIKRVSGVSREKSRALQVNCQQGKVWVRLRTHDMNEVRADLPIQYDGPDIAIAMNAAYLVEALERGSVMTLTATRPDSPMRADYEGRTHDAAVIMPLRF